MKEVFGKEVVFLDYGWLKNRRKRTFLSCARFYLGYVTKILLLDKSVVTTAVMIASLVGFLVIPLAGYLSDKFGRCITYRMFCLLLMIYAFPAFMLLDSKNEIIVILTIIVGMSLASLGIFGVQAAWGVELFWGKKPLYKNGFC